MWLLPSSWFAKLRIGKFLVKIDIIGSIPSRSTKSNFLKIIQCAWCRIHYKCLYFWGIDLLDILCGHEWLGLLQSLGESRDWESGWGVFKIVDYFLI